MSSCIEERVAQNPIGRGTKQKQLPKPHEAAKELREGKSCEQTTVVGHRQGSSGAEPA